MRRGSTPTNTFTVDVDLTDATVFITYTQKGKTVFELTNDDLTITEDTITAVLTQAQTLALADGEVSIQLAYVTADGTADRSNIIKTTAEHILKDSEIEYVSD